MYTKCSLGVLRGRDHLRDLGVVGKIIIQYILDKYDVEIRTG